MTLQQLIDEASGPNYFPVLYHRDAAALAALAGRSLSTYQRKAGILKSVKGGDDTNVIALPEDYLTVAAIEDKGGLSHFAEMAGGQATVDEGPSSLRPYTLTYLAKISDLALSGTVPEEAEDYVLRHLVALIAIPNTARARAVAIATGQQIELPSDQELRDQVALIEEEMSEVRAFLPVLLS